MMKNQFHDMASNVWTINLTLSTIAILKSKFGFDADALVVEGNSNLDCIILDGTKFAEMLEFVLAAEIGERGLGETFLHHINGRVLDDAAKPFLHAIAETMPRFKREALNEIIDRLDEVVEQESKKMAANVRNLKL